VLHEKTWTELLKINLPIGMGKQEIDNDRDLDYTPNIRSAAHSRHASVDTKRRRTRRKPLGQPSTPPENKDMV
jgi:hypothetical protein